MNLFAIRLPRFFEAVARHAVTYLAACLCYSLRVLFFVGEVHLPFAIFFLSCLISLLLPRGKQLLTVQKKARLQPVCVRHSHRGFFTDVKKLFTFVQRSCSQRPPSPQRFPQWSMIALPFVIRTSTDCSTLARVLREQFLHACKAACIYVCVRVLLYIFVYIYVCVCSCTYTCSYMVSIYLSFIYLSIYLSVCLSIYLSVCLSV